MSPTGAAKAPFWDAPSEAAEAVRTRTGSPDQTASVADVTAGVLNADVADVVAGALHVT